MEVSLLQAEGIPEGCVLSVRAGTTRRQACVEGQQPFRLWFPKCHPTKVREAVKVDLLANLGSVAFEVRPGAEEYPTTINMRDGASARLKLRFCENTEGAAAAAVPPSAPPPVAAGSLPSATGMLSPARRHVIAMESSTYLDEHDLFTWIQGLLADLTHDRPSDPWKYIDNHTAAARKARGLLEPRPHLSSTSDCAPAPNPSPPTAMACSNDDRSSDLSPSKSRPLVHTECLKARLRKALEEEVLREKKTFRDIARVRPGLMLPLGTPCDTPMGTDKRSSPACSDLVGREPAQALAAGDESSSLRTPPLQQGGVATALVAPPMPAAMPCTPPLDQFSPCIGAAWARLYARFPDTPMANDRRSSPACTDLVGREPAQALAAGDGSSSLRTPPLQQGGAATALVAAPMPAAVPCTPPLDRFSPCIGGPACTDLVGREPAQALAAGDGSSSLRTPPLPQGGAATALVAARMPAAVPCTLPLDQFSPCIGGAWARLYARFPRMCRPELAPEPTPSNPFGASLATTGPATPSTCISVDSSGTSPSSLQNDEKCQWASSSGDLLKNSDLPKAVFCDSASLVSTAAEELSDVPDISPGSGSSSSVLPPSPSKSLEKIDLKAACGAGTVTELEALKASIWQRNERCRNENEALRKRNTRLSQLRETGENASILCSQNDRLREELAKLLSLKK